MIQQLTNWFREHLFPRRRRPEVSLRQTGVGVRPPAQRQRGSTAAPPRPAERKPLREPDLSFGTEIGGRIEDAGPGKNVLVRSKYLREDTGTHEVLKIIDENLAEEPDDVGFDPYNTGQFDRSRNWSRTRK